MNLPLNLLFGTRWPLVIGTAFLALPFLSPEAAGQHTLIASDGRGISSHGSWLGVKVRDELRFHHLMPGEVGMGKRPFPDFPLPPDADEFIFSRDRLGVRTGRKLQFFDTAQNFRPLPEFDFVLSEQPTELLLLGDRLGVRTGRALKFYEIGAGFKHRPEYDYTVPAGTSELVIAHNSTGRWLGVRRGAQLTFHDIDRGYRPHPDHRFTLPDDTEEIALSGLMLLVRHDDVVSFYDFGKKVMNKPRFQVALEPAILPDLLSLRGTMVSLFGDDETGIPSRIWAKGDLLRTEVAANDTIITTIQRGDTLYTFDESTNRGKRDWLGTGLASVGLIRQIEEVKANGKRVGHEKLDGVPYQKYSYDRNAPEELVLVYLSLDTSLPRAWISLVRKKDGSVSKMSMIYRDLEANVELPDALFELPSHVDFAD